MPARGKRFIEPEKVPIINNGVLIPKPKANKSKKPKILFAMVATMVRISARPGERQGEATEPLASPNIKIENADPDFEIDPLFCINRGM